MGEKTLHRQSFGLAQGLRFIEPLATPTSSNFQNSPEAHSPSQSISDSSQPAARESLRGSTLPSTPQEPHHSQSYPRQTAHPEARPYNTREASPDGEPQSLLPSVPFPTPSHTPIPDNRASSDYTPQGRIRQFCTYPS